LILYFNSHAHHQQQSPTPEATARTHHFPTHAQRMSTCTRSATPGMGGEWKSDGKNGGQDYKKHLST